MNSSQTHFAGSWLHGLRRRAAVFGCLVIVGQVLFPCVALAEPPPKPDEPRVQIREEVLKATPLGSSPQAVLDYILKAFERRDDAASPEIARHPARGVAAKASGKAGVQSIRLVLGQYLRNPATFLMEIPIVTKTTTTVQWAFDKDAKLLEVFVDKDSELGDGSRE